MKRYEGLSVLRVVFHDRDTWRAKDVRQTEGPGFEVANEEELKGVDGSTELERSYLVKI